MFRSHLGYPKLGWEHQRSSRDSTRVAQTSNADLETTPPPQATHAPDVVRSALDAPWSSAHRGSGAQSPSQAGWARPPSLSSLLKVLGSPGSSIRRSPRGQGLCAVARGMRERQSKVGRKGVHSACGGWFGMMNDGSRAFERRRRTSSRCTLARSVVLAAFEITPLLPRAPGGRTISPSAAANLRWKAAPVGTRCSPAACDASPLLPHGFCGLEFPVFLHRRRKAHSCNGPLKAPRGRLEAA